MLIAEYSYETDIKVQRREAFRLGKEEGAEQKAIEAAKKFIKMGFPIDQISEGIGLSKEEVQKLAEENNK